MRPWVVTSADFPHQLGDHDSVVFSLAAKVQELNEKLALVEMDLIRWVLQ